MADAPTYREKLTEAPKYYFQGLWRQVNDKQIFLWAQAISFKVLITIVPLVVLAVAIFGRVLDRPRPFEAVSGFISGFLPAYRAADVIRVLQQLQNASGALTLIGIGGLIFFAMTLFTTLRVVVSNIFQEEWHEQRALLPGYLFDLRMAAQVGLLFLLTFALTLGMNTLNAAGFEFMQEIGLSAIWLREGWGRFFTYIGLIVPFLLSVGMFFQLFLFIPKPHPPKRSALLGAVVTALLWELAKFAFTFYATRLGRFDRYRPETVAEEGVDATAVLGDTFGLILAFVFWVYYSGIVLCIGGIIALLHEKRHRAKRKRKAMLLHPEPAAVPEQNGHTGEAAAAEQELSTNR